MIPELKADQVLVPAPGGFFSHLVEVRLIDQRALNGVWYWWTETTDTNGDKSLGTYKGSELKVNFVVKPTFYRVGKKYRFRKTGRTDTWLILDVYQVQSPAYGDKVKAVAKMITDRGLEDIQTLSQGDFERMVQV